MRHSPAQIKPTKALRRKIKKTPPNSKWGPKGRRQEV